MIFRHDSTVASVLLLIAAGLGSDDFVYPSDVNERTGLVGEACHHRASGRAGVCRPFLSCPSARQDRLQDRHPQLCGFSNGTALLPDVCCALDSPETEPTSKRLDELPPSVTCAELSNRVMQEDTGRRPGGVARRMCVEYQRQICSGEVSREERFVGVAFGAFFQNADPLEYPHMALLGYGDRDDIEYNCGGSLISSNFVLTAAHCVSNGRSAVRWVLLGALNRTRSLSDAGTRQLLEVAEIIVHPNFTARARYHDIALLRLAEEARLKADDVRPACVHTELDGDDLLGEVGVVTGWGADAFGNDGSEQLLKGRVTVRRLQDCHSVDTRLPRGLDEKAHMCAGGDGTNPTDACNGDSGGPLQFPALLSSPGCMFRVAGIVSFGPPCGIGFPGVYTRVATYVPWIERIVWPPQQQGCLADTGPGTVARRACDRYLDLFCAGARRSSLPGLRESEQCHFQKTQPPLGKPEDGFDTQSGQNSSSPANGGRFEVALRHEFPHQALLSYGDSGEVACAGALISTNFVLTAAHCAALGCSGPVTAVHLGKIDRTSVAIEYVPVKDVIVHPEYDARLRHNDVALLRLARDVPMNIQVRPACLFSDEDGAIGGFPATVVASGLTATGRWESTSGELRKARLPAEYGLSCGPGDSRTPQSAVNDQMCVMSKDGQVNVPGETGGPVQTVHRVLDGLHVHQVVGILSALSACGSNQSDTYMRVSAFVPWIESIVWPR